ncbi:MAG: Ppx/GppA phosphatase family protein [Acidimicrobiales bacterium]
MPLRGAVVDLGSSSFHLLVCDLCADGRLVTVLRRRALLNLGADVGSGGSLPPGRVAAAVAAARRLRRALDDAEPEVVVPVATAALREASNGPDVVARIEKALGHPVTVLSGAEEARLCFAGQRAGVWTGNGPMVGLDLGGGSLELASGDDTEIWSATSLPLGVARLAGEMSAGDPLGHSRREWVEGRVDQAFAGARVIPPIGRDRDVPGRAVVSGGTARALARLAASAGRGGPRSGMVVNQTELPVRQVRELAYAMAELDLAARVAMPGMPARRAALIPVGAAVLAAAGSNLGIERYVVSEWGLREGALLEAFRRD